jgi:hypothetical protein
MSARYRPIIINAFPESSWPEIQRRARLGIQLADELIKERTVLNWAVGQDQRGDLRRVGVMWSVNQACKDDDLPFSSSIRKNTAKNCHHVELASQNVYLHITRTQSLLSMPRDTTLRDNERASNQGDLFKDTGFTTDLSSIKRWYAWLTFGADEKGEFTHLAIGLPKYQEHKWLDIVSILQAAGEASSPEEEPRPLGPEDSMKFRAAVQRLLDLDTDTNQSEKG